MDKFLKILDFVLVIAAIVLAVYVGKNIGLEYLMRGKEEPVTLSMTAPLGDGRGINNNSN